MPLRLLLRDRDAAVADALAAAFSGLADVEVSQGDIFDRTADAIVSPANSFGFMDGGIDLAYSRRFGWDLSERLREQLQRDHGGELPVGQAVLVETFDERTPWMISAPTMRIPDDVSETVNAYLAFRAALRCAVGQGASVSPPIQSVLCPGLCTAVGRMPARRAARQMHAAYGVAVLGQTLRPISLGSAVDPHARLLD